MNTSDVRAEYRYAPISPKKVAPVMDIVRGKNAVDAKLILLFDETKAGQMILKTLKSAIANAKNNNSMNEKELFITHIQVNGGPMRKTGRPVARGRWGKILKRTSHIIVGLSERKSLLLSEKKSGPAISLKAPKAAKTEEAKVEIKKVKDVKTPKKGKGTQVQGGAN